MVFPTWFANTMTRLESKKSRRARRRPAALRPTPAEPHLEPLEERLALSGFGPADGAYIVEPWIGSYSDVQIQPGDQKIVAAGQVNPNNDYTDLRMAIARYDSLGNPDSTYGSGGPSILPLNGVSAPPLGPSNESGHDLVLQSDGKAVVSGFKSADSSFAVVRFNTSGTLDSGFGNAGWNSLDPAFYDGYDPAMGVGLQSTGKVVVTGRTTTGSLSSATPSSAAVARFTASGAIDSGKGAFGQIVKGKASGYTLSTYGFTRNIFFDLTVQPDDKLVAVGKAFTDANSQRLIVARYTASGNLDTTFNGNGYSVFLPAGISTASGQAVALQSINGVVKIVVSGFSTGTDGANDMLVVRYNSNGTLDTSFGGGSGYVRLDDGAANQSSEYGNDVAIQPDGKIVVGGWTSVPGNPSTVFVARFNVDGTPDTTFAPGGFKNGVPLPGTGYHSFEGLGVALQSDGSIIVAGSDDQDSTNAFVPHPFLMRFYGTSAPLLAASSPTGTPATETRTVGAVQPLVNEATSRWKAAGADVSALKNLDVRIANLGGSTLGRASGHTIWLDDNAAGWGWFVDATPRDDSEFFRRGDQGEEHRMDLLTVVMHELGHLLQQDHDADGVMAATLGAGVRNTSLVNEDSQVVDAVFSQFNEPHADIFLGTVLDEHLWLHRPKLQRRR